VLAASAARDASPPPSCHHSAESSSPCCGYGTEMTLRLAARTRVRRLPTHVKQSARLRAASTSFAYPTRVILRRNASPDVPRCVDLAVHVQYEFETSISTKRSVRTQPTRRFRKDSYEIFAQLNRSVGTGNERALTGSVSLSVPAPSSCRSVRACRSRRWRTERQAGGSKQPRPV
jgi:hypothetical protein